MQLSGSITRAELALADLSLETPGSYRIVSYGPGSASKRRTTAESMWIDGRVLVNSVLDVQMSILVVRVAGITTAVLDNNLNDLLRALDQLTFNLTVVTDGVAHTWACESADYEVGSAEGLDKFQLFSKMQEVTCRIPRNPTPVAGSF